MRTWRKTAWLVFSVFSLLSGWLSPGYAAKTIGPQLKVFLNNSPGIAAVVAQSAFIILLLVPSSSSSNRLSATGKVTSNLRTCCSLRAFKLGCPFGILLLAVHTAWYSSITRTNVATNTVLWNTDTVTTPLVLALVSLQLPSLRTLVGGGIAIAGVYLSMDGDPTGNTPLGCSLVLGASLGYATTSVLVEKLRESEDEEIAVVHMLAWSGIVALFAMLIGIIIGAIFMPEELTTWYGASPPPQWLLFMASAAISLNVGWLWCAELAGACWTAMVACLTIPIAMVLDYQFFGIKPELIAFVGAALVLLGFSVVSSTEILSDCSSPCCRPEHAGSQDESRSRCWKKCFGSGTEPLLLLAQSHPVQRVTE